jgi:hypothetical protein
VRQKYDRFLGLGLILVRVRVAVTMKDDHVAIMTGPVPPPAARASVAAARLRVVCASTFLIVWLVIATVKPSSSFKAHSLLPMAWATSPYLGFFFFVATRSPVRKPTS